MKRFMLLLILALSLSGTIWAQQTVPTPAAPPPTTPAGAPPVAANPGQITPVEWQELRAAHAAALQANPDLTAESRKLAERMHAFEDKIDAAMVKADPTLAPIIAKIEAARHAQGTASG